MLTRFTDPMYKNLYRAIKDLPPQAISLIKKASIEEETIGDLPDTAFAWPEKRAYPVHTAQDAAVSYVYAQLNDDTPDYVLNKIAEALKIYEINPKQLSLNYTTKKANFIPQECYALPHRKLWPMLDSETVKLACEAFTRDAKNLSTGEKFIAANQIVKKAKEHNVSLHPRINKYAGQVACDKSLLLENIDCRITASKEPYTHKYIKIAEEVRKLPAICYNSAPLIKIAVALEKVDKESGIDSLYHRTLNDPISSVFNTDKLAEEVVDLGGTSIPVSVLEQVPLEAYGDIFGDEFVEEVASNGSLDLEKLQTVLKTMPKDLKLIFIKQIKAYL